VGSRALMSLRVEKGYGSWGRDYSPEYWPQETGLAGLVKLNKPFLNRDACAAVMERPPREVLRTLEIDVTSADATGNEPIFDLAGQPAGKVSSGAYGYHVEKSLALAYLRPDIVAGAELDVMILGRPHRARVLPGPAFDAEGKRLRA
jgi:dimethylglycine dehydrogenase